MTALDRLQAADERLLLVMRRLPHHAVTDAALSALSAATDRGRGWFALAATGGALDRRRRGRWARAGLALWVAEELGVAIKRRVPRARPVLEGLPPLAATPSPLSFPSTHTANAVTAACLLSDVVPKPLLWALAAVTGFSRPYLGVHYPSDVLAGAALGAIVGRAGAPNKRS